ncbi:uncharacterized protein LOC144568100 [Carex rostrata]
MRTLQQAILTHQSLHPSQQNPTLEDNLLQKFHKAEEDLALYWRQRAKILWHAEGDRNTAFFQAAASHRRRINTIRHVRIDEEMVITGQAQIRQAFVSYFKNIYCPVQDPQTLDPKAYFYKFQSLAFPQIPDSAHQSLITAPLEREIKMVLDNMGPDKSPGPDGISARLLQTHWKIFKEDLTVTIGRAFREAKVPDEWLPSYITLIPKTEDAEKPKDYRPITVGNITYRLLMKIVAQRLQPHMRKLISTEQTAFLKGRNITDNTILAREIIHSFNSAGYKKESFMLKADVNKAFDTVQWEFIYAAMRAVNFPNNLIKLVKYCLEAGRVTIMINGQKDGFLKPNRGLRQGCPLSPYLFILVTEFLTKSLQLAQINGSIRGIKLASTAPVITHSMYADDLVLMGLASEAEAKAFKAVLDEFAEYTGLSINPDKSMIWFSVKCDEECRERIRSVLRAAPAGESEKYLGVYVAQNTNQLDMTHDMLVSRFNGRLAGWKLNMLSYAGRLALIKSVLISLPVYFMSIAQLPRRTIDTITRLIRDFLWGKVDGERYLVPIAWHKICCSTEEGGLGIRDLELFNKSLLLKVVWHLAEDQDRLWVKVMKAKYYSRGGFWAVKNKTGCSRLWKTVQNLKDYFKDQILWSIADGTGIPALNQPWYEGWELTRVLTHQQRDATVASLVCRNTTGWDPRKVTEIMGDRLTQVVLQVMQVPSNHSLLKDKLIWLPSKTGVYTAKMGYEMLKSHMPLPVYNAETKQMLQKIWEWKGVLPRVRTFLWRAIHGGLPTTAMLHTRIRRVDPVCSRCHMENEFLMHLLFFCPGARATWHSSTFPLRVEQLPLDFSKTLLMITQVLDEDQIISFCNMLWEIWKARNSEIFAGKKIPPQIIIKQARALTPPIHPPCQTTGPPQVIPILIPSGTRTILVDASWETSKKTGTGVMCFDGGGRLQEAQYTYMTAHDPFHAEAHALLQAVKHIIASPTTVRWVIFSDCKTLVDVINNQSMESLPSWKAGTTVEECIEGWKEVQHYTQLHHAGRERMSQPHILANAARTTAQSSTRENGIDLVRQLGIEMFLLPQFFSLG